jgi:hypothetical protein
VNKGCILLNQRHICAGEKLNVAGGSANIEAMLDQESHCEATFTWPEEYGDVHYGADDCLYDSNGKLNVGSDGCAGIG